MLVNKKLNSNKNENQLYKKYKSTRFATIIITMFIFGATSVFAMTNVNILKEFFVGDTKILEKEIINPNLSIQDNNYKLTLEQVLSDINGAIVVISVEGLNEDAIKNLQSGLSFLFDNEISLNPLPGTKIKMNGFIASNFGDNNTPSKNFSVLTSMQLIIQIMKL